MDGSGTADRVDRAAHAREPVDVLSISKRLQKDSRWLTVIEPLRTRMMRECRQKGMSKAEAQAWTYPELDRLFPPEDTERLSAPDSQSEPAHRGVTGLGDLPDAWPTLPANASLQVEISWVSANRLRVRDGSGVDLSRALVTVHGLNSDLIAFRGFRLPFSLYRGLLATTMVELFWRSELPLQR